MNDAPHIGHAYTTVIGDARRPLAPAARRRRLLPHRHRRARPQGAAGRRGQRRHAPGVGRPRPSSASATRGSCSTSPTTTSSARPSPATTAAVDKLLQACYDAGDIELGTYEGLYCVVVRGVLHRGRAGRRQLPDPRPPGRAGRGGELLLQALAVTATACSTGTRRIPTRCSPRSRRNEALGFIRQGLLDFSISRTSLTWGIPMPVGRAPRHLRVVRRAHQLHHGRRLRRPTTARFDDVVAGRHHLIGKDILRFHCVYWPAMLLSAGLEPPAAHPRRTAGCSSAARR